MGCAVKVDLGGQPLRFGLTLAVQVRLSMLHALTAVRESMQRQMVKSIYNRKRLSY